MGIPLLAVKPCPAVPEAELDGPGFAWWYVDLVDPAGNGVVIIGAFGLPFLPGLASADRNESPTTARARPSLNVAVYRNHKRAAYFLQEHPPEDCSWEQDLQTFGTSTFRSETHGRDDAIEVRLDLEIPGSKDRLTGVLKGSGVSPGHAGGEQGPHGWTVLATGEATVDFKVGDRPLLQTTGRLYHDSNWSLRPLHRLNISRWLWARVPDTDGELVVWLLWPDDPLQAPVARLFRAGEVMAEIPCEMSWLGQRWGLFGMSAPARLILKTDTCTWRLKLDRCVDDGFFYQRWLLNARRGNGPVSIGTCEVIRPHWVDQAAQRPLVRMAHHRLGQRNSIWLPLFNGPRHDRWSRLWAWWRGVGR